MPSHRIASSRSAQPALTRHGLLALHPKRTRLWRSLDPRPPPPAARRRRSERREPRAGGGRAGRVRGSERSQTSSGPERLRCLVSGARPMRRTECHSVVVRRGFRFATADALPLACLGHRRAPAGRMRSARVPGRPAAIRSRCAGKGDSTSMARSRSAPLGCAIVSVAMRTSEKARWSYAIRSMLVGIAVILRMTRTAGTPSFETPVQIRGNLLLIHSAFLGERRDTRLTELQLESHRTARVTAIESSIGPSIDPL